MAFSLHWWPSQQGVPLWTTGGRVSLDVCCSPPFPLSLSPLLIPSLLLVFAVLFYHGGCWLEYKLGIQDTARVVPVHGVWYVSTHSILIPRIHLHKVLGPGNETRAYPHPFAVVCGALLAQHYSWEAQQQSVTSMLHLRVSVTVT